MTPNIVPMKPEIKQVGSIFQKPLDDIQELDDIQQSDRFIKKYMLSNRTIDILDSDKRKILQPVRLNTPEVCSKESNMKKTGAKKPIKVCNIFRNSNNSVTSTNKTDSIPERAKSPIFQSLPKRSIIKTQGLDKNNFISNDPISRMFVNKTDPKKVDFMQFETNSNHNITIKKAKYERIKHITLDSTQLMNIFKEINNDRLKAVKAGTSAVNMKVLTPGTNIKGPSTIINKVFDETTKENEADKKKTELNGNCPVFENQIKNLNERNSAIKGSLVCHKRVKSEQPTNSNC